MLCNEVCVASKSLFVILILDNYYTGLSYLKCSFLLKYLNTVYSAII